MIATKNKFDRRSVFIQHNYNEILDELVHLEKKTIKDVLNDILGRGIENKIQKNPYLRFKLSVNESVDDDEQAEIEDSLSTLTKQDRKPARVLRYNEKSKMWEEVILDDSI